MWYSVCGFPVRSVAPKSMQDLKVFQELSVGEKRETVVNYIAANAELIVVSSREVLKEIEKGKARA